MRADAHHGKVADATEKPAVTMTLECEQPSSTDPRDERGGGGVRPWVASAVLALVNVAAAVAFWHSGAAGAAWRWMSASDPPRTLPRWWVFAAYLVMLFAGHVTVGLPVEWLVACKGRATSRGRWWRHRAVDIVHHGVYFVVGSALIVMVQVLMPSRWPAVTAGVLLVLFVASDRLAPLLTPHGLEPRPRRFAVTLLAWAWVASGVVWLARWMPAYAVATPLCAAWLAVWLSPWVAAGAVIFGLAARVRNRPEGPDVEHLLRLSMWTPNVVAGVARALPTRQT